MNCAATQANCMGCRQRWRQQPIRSFCKKRKFGRSYIISTRRLRIESLTNHLYTRDTSAACLSAFSLQNLVDESFSVGLEYYHFSKTVSETSINHFSMPCNREVKTIQFFLTLKRPKEQMSIILCCRLIRHFITRLPEWDRSYLGLYSCFGDWPHA